MQILFFPGKHSCLVVRVFLHDCFLRQTPPDVFYLKNATRGYIRVAW
jgi:hypothetical protein